MTFNLNGSVNQEFNFIDKILKKNLFAINSNKIHILLSLPKMTFNLNGSVNQELNFIDKM